MLGVLSRTLIIMSKCTHADNTFKYLYYHPICRYYGNILCFTDSIECAHFKERDYLDEIVETLDCMPLTYSSDWSV